MIYIKNNQMFNVQEDLYLTNASSIDRKEEMVCTMENLLQQQHTIHCSTTATMCALFVNKLSYIIRSSYVEFALFDVETYRDASRK